MPDYLQISLRNDSPPDRSGQPLYAYITGLALREGGGRRCFLRPDGRTLYFPTNPPRIGSPLAEDCAIPLGPRPGDVVTVTIPQIAGGRVWISRGTKLSFLLNPGGPGGTGALVEPSVLNPSDANSGVDFGFAEFTLDGAQLYANVSFVDFVPRVPISLTLQTSRAQQTVAGMPADGIDRLAAGLRAQAAADGRPWDKLVVNSSNGNGSGVLRVLAPTHSDAVRASFAGYFEGYVAEVLRWYNGGRARLRIDTQAGPGVVQGWTDLGRGEFVIGGEVFGRPTTADILGCNSGPFTTGPSPLRNAVIPRLAAAFARSALLETGDHPSHPDTFYGGHGRGRACPVNHYVRLVHECLPDGKGYAFAYDDVQPSGGGDQSGKVNAGDPVLLTIGVGGARAHEGGWVPYGPGQVQQQHIPMGPNPGSAAPQGGLRDKVRELKGRILK